MCNQFFLELLVQHNLEFQQLNMLIYDSFYNFLSETEMIFIVFSEGQILLIIF